MIARSPGESPSRAPATTSSPSTASTPACSPCRPTASADSRERLIDLTRVTLVAGNLPLPRNQRCLGEVRSRVAPPPQHPFSACDVLATPDSIRQQISLCGSVHGHEVTTTRLIPPYDRQCPSTVFDQEDVPGVGLARLWPGVLPSVQTFAYGPAQYDLRRMGVPFLNLLYLLTGPPQHGRWDTKKSLKRGR